jgi:hypothetical protein
VTYLESQVFAAWFLALPRLASNEFRDGLVDVQVLVVRCLGDDTLHERFVRRMQEAAAEFV